MKRDTMPKTVLACLGLAALIGAAPAGAQPRSDTSRPVSARVETVRLYQQGRNRDEQTERLTKTLRIGATGELDVSNVAGDIAVTRSGGSEATIEIVKTSRGRTPEDAREMLGLVQVEITERNGRAEVKTRYPGEDETRRNNRRNVNVSVAYTITAPANTRLTIGSISGSIKVTDILGDLALNTISGAVRVANAGRIATAKSISGTVEIVDTQIDGTVEAESISGDVLLRKVRARRLGLGTVSGNVTVQDVQCDRVEAHSVSGNVEFGGALAKSGRYDLSSHSGTIRVVVSGDAGFELDANSFSGSVRSDLPLTLRGRDDRGRQRAVRGVYGDGSALLHVTTFSGSIVIARR